MGAEADNEKKVLLIFPGKPEKEACRVLPLSILSLAGPLIEAGFEPILIDQRVDRNWKEKIEKVAPTTLFAGISSLTGIQILYGIKAAKLIREVNPKLKIVWGGVHPTLIPEQTLQNKFVDIIVRGEGEKTVVDLATCLKTGKDLSSVKGISFKENGKIIHNPDREFVDLDTLPPIPYELLDITKYAVDEYFHYQSARGCPHRCEFCDVIVFNRRRWRCKSAEKTIDELSYIVNRYKPKTIEFVDDNFFVDKDRVEAICTEVIKKGLKFNWIASCRPDYFRKFDMGFLKLVKEAGCREIYVGAESGSQRILDMIHKDCKVEDIIEAAEKLVQVGIRMSCNFMCSFPGETKEDIEETIKVIHELRKIGKTSNEIHIGGILMYLPYPGSSLFYKVVELGFVPPKSLEEWGRVSLNDKRIVRWLDKKHVNYIHTISHITRGGIEDIPVRTILKNLFTGKIKKAGWGVLRKLAYWRWQHQYFKFPLDVELMALVRRAYPEIS